MLTQTALVDPPVPVLGEIRTTPGSRKSALLIVLVTVSLAVLARAIGPLWISRAFHPLPLTDLRTGAACLLALAMSITIHELGHLMVALLLRFEVTGLSIGPFRLSSIDKQWNLQIMWRRFFVGSVTAIPRSQDGWRWRMLAVVIAGPAATALLTCLVFALIISDLPRFSGPFWQAALQINTLLFVLGLIPTAANAEQASDARLVIVLLRYDRQARNILLYNTITQLRLEGRRPRHYPEWFIRRLGVANAGPAMEAVFARTIAEWAIDRGDLATASAWNQRLGAIAAQCDPKRCYSALAHSACLDLILSNDAKSAAIKLERVPMGLLTPKWFSYRCRAAREIAKDNLEGALKNLRRAELHRPAAALPYFQYEQLLISVLRQTARDRSRHL